MKYQIYNYKDTNLKVFDAPIFSTDDREVFVTNVERTLKKIKPFDFQFAKDKALYLFGWFDDVKGEFEMINKPVLLLVTNEVLPSFDDVIKNYLASSVRDQKNDEVLYRFQFNKERELLRQKELKKGGKANA